MATVRKRGKVWQAIFYDAEGNRCFRTTHCTDKRAAESAARRFEREAQDPDNTAANPTTISDALEALIGHREEEVGAGRRSAATVQMYRVKSGHLKRVFELDAAGEHVPFRLARLTARYVDDYISTRRAEGAADNTIAKELVTLRASLKLAKRRGEWAGDVEAIMPIAFAPGYKPVERHLEPKELALLLAHATADHAARICFAVATSANLGARAGVH